MNNVPNDWLSKWMIMRITNQWTEYIFKYEWMIVQMNDTLNEWLFG